MKNSFAFSSFGSESAAAMYKATTFSEDAIFLLCPPVAKVFGDVPRLNDKVL